MDSTFKALESYFELKSNVVTGGYRFHSRRQRNGESIDAYLSVLRDLVSKCEYDQLMDSIIGDRIVEKNLLMITSVRGYF